MRKKLDITPLPEYHKSLEGGFVGAGFSAVTCFVTLFIAAKYSLPASYVVFIGSLASLIIYSRGIYINFNNAVADLQKERSLNRYIDHDLKLLEDLNSYLSFNQMQRVKERDFAGIHDSEDFNGIYDYVHYFSDVSKNFMSVDLIKESGDLFQAAREFVNKFGHYNSPNKDISSQENIKLDISKNLRDGTQEQRERYYREVRELNNLAGDLYEKYEKFIHKANMTLKSKS